MLDEKAIKMDNKRKREGNTNQGNNRDRRNNEAKSKPDLQAVQGNRRDSHIKETWKTKERTNRGGNRSYKGCIQGIQMQCNCTANYFKKERL